jgi:hypothetical protein
MNVGIHVRQSLFLPDFNETRIFVTDFSKNTHMEFAEWEERHDEVAFRNFCERA